MVTRLLFVVTAHVFLLFTLSSRAEVFPTGGGSEALFGVPGGTGAGSGDVVGPLSSTDSHVVLFDGDTGRLIKVATGTGYGYVTSGVFSVKSGTSAQYLRADGTVSTLDTSAVAEGSNLYFTNARAIAATLTGYTSGAGTVSSSDTVLQAIQKLNGNVALKAPLDSPTFTGTVTGTFSGNVTGNVTGNASTATALASNPSDCSSGEFATAIAANGNLTCATPSGGGGGVDTVGTFSGSSISNGASISGSTITFGPADGTNPGMVTTGTQTIAGAKTFSSDVTSTGFVAGQAEWTGGTGFARLDIGGVDQLYFDYDGAPQIRPGPTIGAYPILRILPNGNVDRGGMQLTGNMGPATHDNYYFGQIGYSGGGPFTPTISAWKSIASQSLVMGYASGNDFPTVAAGTIKVKTGTNLNIESDNLSLNTAFGLTTSNFNVATRDVTITGGNATFQIPSGTFYQYSSGTMTVESPLLKLNYGLEIDSTDLAVVANKNIIGNGGNDIGIYADTTSYPIDRASLKTLLLGYDLNNTVPGTAAKVNGEIKVKDSTPLTLTTVDDGVAINTSGTKPTCDSSTRGQIFYEAGGAGVADLWYFCSKDAADAYSWVAK